MCGIAGILHFNNQSADKEMIRRMTYAMAHRGPDADSTFTEDEIALGHRRLSIIDLSEAANQPFTDHSGRYIIVFNGEIYNYKEVKALLPDYPFRTNSDTETIVAAYDRWGIKCVDHFKGMFAFAIWDRQEKQLVIVRDRLGVKPLYYYNKDGIFLFASEQRALLASRLIQREMSKFAVYDYFRIQSVASPFGAISGIFQLQPGTYITVKDGKATTNVYWDIATPREPARGDKKKIQQHIYELLLKSVERRMVSDVPVGAFLSGGIDSSAVVALMNQVSSAKPKTFVVGFEEKEYDESDYAELVAKKFNTDHHRILMKPEIMLDELTNALDAMDTPSGDGINTYVVSKAIKKAGITVALSGIGGDELFAGYPFFKQFHLLKKFRYLWPVASPALAASSLLVGNEKMRDILRKPTTDIVKIYPVLRQMLPRGHINKLLGYKDNFDGTTFIDLWLKAKNIRKYPFLSQVSIAEYVGYTKHTLLKDADQMSMAVSLEMREPFFDHELIEYVLTVPDAIKYPHYPKQLLVESLNGLLPDEIVHRRKQGFLFPWEQWLKKELKDFGEKHIRQMGERGLMDGPAIMNLWKQFLAGDKRIRWADVWLFIVLDYWMEKNGVY
jgi:asparagine synthase (glutamine-hydrolysing)